MESLPVTSTISHSCNGGFLGHGDDSKGDKWDGRDRGGDGRDGHGRRQAGGNRGERVGRKRGGKRGGGGRDPALLEERADFFQGPAYPHADGVFGEIEGAGEIPVSLAFKVAAKNQMAILGGKSVDHFVKNGGEALPRERYFCHGE